MIDNKKDLITKYILLKIQLGAWKPGLKINSAGQLAILFSTTIQTVHKALAQFVSEKILITKPKIGYFVRKNNYISPNDYLGISDNKNYKIQMKEIKVCKLKYANYRIFEFETKFKNIITKIHYIFILKKTMIQIEKEVFGYKFKINNNENIIPKYNNFNIRQCLALIGEIIYRRKDTIKPMPLNLDFSSHIEIKNNSKQYLYVESKTYNKSNNIIEFAKTFLNLDYINWDINLCIKK